MARPLKTKFPVSLDDMLRLAMPKQRPEDRFKFYRMEVRDSLHRSLGRKPTAEEIEQQIIKDRGKRYEEINVFDLRVVLREHLPVFKSELRTKRARAAAVAKWKNKNGPTLKN